MNSWDGVKFFSDPESEAVEDRVQTDKIALAAAMLGGLVALVIPGAAMLMRNDFCGIRVLDSLSMTLFCVPPLAIFGALGGFLAGRAGATFASDLDSLNSLRHPNVLGVVAGCFLAMLVASVLAGLASIFILMPDCP